MNQQHDSRPQQRIPRGDLTGSDGIYKRDMLVNVHYWRVVNRNGTKLIINNVETNQVLPAGTVFEALADANRKTVWEGEGLTKNKFITPVGYGIPVGARVKASASEIVPADGRVMLMPYPSYPAYPGYYQDNNYPQPY